MSSNEKAMKKTTTLYVHPHDTEKTVRYNIPWLNHSVPVSKRKQKSEKQHDNKTMPQQYHFRILRKVNEMKMMSIQ
jgi:hypothetical protein